MILPEIGGNQMSGNFCKSIANAISGKNVVIYGAVSMGARILNIVDALGEKTLFFLDRDPDKQKNGFCGYEVKAPENILYEDMANTIVLISTVVKVRKEIEETLVNFGFREGIEFVYVPTMRYQTCNLIDPLLGYSRSADINGFKIMGKYDEKNPNILCLGGSTTDYSFFEIKSWPYFLTELLKEDNIKLNVLNGGIVSYTSSQELLKLIRDGLELEPFLVISYSGANDLVGFPMMGNEYLYRVWRQMESSMVENDLSSLETSEHLSVSYGAVSQLEPAEYWYRNEMMMCNICRGFSIPFIGILQSGSYIRNANSHSIYEQRVLNYRTNREYIEQQFKRAKQLVNASNEQNILDFTALFDKCQNVFADDFHVFEQGNEIIAESIYKILKEKKLL